MSAEKKFTFDVEVSKILNIVINSLYKHKDVAIRELISNASDACDKLRYIATTKQDVLSENDELKITISTDKGKRILYIEDSGLGMDYDDLKENLGRIAKSGTEDFVNSLTKAKDQSQAVELIGQFGVGFYSSFMIADEVEVYSKKYDSAQTYKWQSKADGEFTISEVSSEEWNSRGTKIALHLKDDCDDYLDSFYIKNIVNTYSNHICFPIEFVNDGKVDRLNSGNALWTKNKNDITQEEYNNFFKTISHLPGEPFAVIHNKVEGRLEFTNLLFVPSMKPFDLFHPDRKNNGVKLYVKKVYITDNEINILPAYLRFIKGVVDSSDLPLNISRETLQHNLVLEHITDSLVKRVLGDLKKKSEESEEEYQKFWNNFGAVLKEGLCEPTKYKDELIELARFYSLKSPNKLISIKEYLNQMGDDKTIYYITGDSVAKIESNPKLEGFKNANKDVIYLTDAVDDFWVTVVNEYQGNELKSINRANIDLDQNSSEADKNEHNNMVVRFKTVLGDLVSDVKISHVLTDSPACLTVPENGMDIRLERFLLDQKQLNRKMSKILEINPNHNILQYLNSNIENKSKEEDINNIIKILFDQACLMDGEEVENPKDLFQRINKFLSVALSA